MKIIEEDDEDAFKGGSSDKVSGTVVGRILLSQVCDLCVCVLFFLCDVESWDYIHTLPVHSHVMA